MTTAGAWRRHRPCDIIVMDAGRPSRVLPTKMRHSGLDTASYRNVVRWTEDIWNRPAVRRGRMVNRTSGPLEEQLRERHDASDFERRTQDKLEISE